MEACRTLGTKVWPGRVSPFCFVGPSLTHPNPTGGMNACGLALSQITYLIASLTKKNNKSSIVELNQVPEQGNHDTNCSAVFQNSISIRHLFISWSSGTVRRRRSTLSMSSSVRSSSRPMGRVPARTFTRYCLHVELSTNCTDYWTW